MGGVRVAVEGCGHGTLNAIYASINQACKAKGWDGIDLLIIGGDFQSVRNSYDLNCMAVPVKYRELGDFHEYYSGKRVAPYLTLFVGGNHEASNYLRELHYGGWVAPNIYYMGGSNVLRFGPLRIAGLSGIWKGYDYRKPHFERLPYNQDEVRSVFHVREIDTRKLLQIRTQVDVGISHDWPNGVEWLGDFKWLYKKKDRFEADARSGRLGSIAARQVLDRLKPPHWFSAHLHIKYSALVDHTQNSNGNSHTTELVPSEAASSVPVLPTHNTDEIDLDMDDDDVEPSQQKNNTTNKDQANAVDDELRAQLPASFAKPVPPEKKPDPPANIPNTTTHFLALDKCLPRRQFLQLLELFPFDASSDCDESPSLQYDPEWLAITKAFAEHIQFGDASAQTTRDQGRAEYLPLIEEAEKWIQENVTAQGKLTVPNNFTITAPVYDVSDRPKPHDMPREYSNPQTAAFCELLQMTNPFASSEEDILARAEAGPKPSQSFGNERGFRGGGRGGGGHRGGQHGSNRGRGRGGRGRY